MNPLYAKMAGHYGVSVLPARVRRPKDKAAVESCVLQVQRRVLAPLRDRIFLSLDELRSAVLDGLEEFNARPMKDHCGKSRRERFDELDRPHARLLSQDRFCISSIASGVLVQKNYHVLFEHHHYSVPHALVGKRVDIHHVGGTIEVYLDGEHVCRHAKQPGNGGYCTVDQHMPTNHAHARGLSPSWLILKAGEVGPSTSSAVKALLERKRHPEQAFRAAQGVIGLSRRYGADRLENACARALHYGSVGYGQVKSILEDNLDRQPLPGVQVQEEAHMHGNVRGGKYYGSVRQGGV